MPQRWRAHGSAHSTGKQMLRDTLCHSTWPVPLSCRPYGCLLGHAPDSASLFTRRSPEKQLRQSPNHRQHPDPPCWLLPRSANTGGRGLGSRCPPRLPQVPSPRRALSELGLRSKMDLMAPVRMVLPTTQKAMEKDHKAVESPPRNRIKELWTQTCLCCQ